MEKLQQAEIAIKKIIELIFPPEAQDFDIASKVDEKGIFLIIIPKTQKAAGILVGKNGRNALFLKRVMRRWAIFKNCFVSLRVEVKKEP